MFGHPMVEDCEVDVETGEIKPVVTIVTDIQAWSCLVGASFARPVSGESRGPAPARRRCLTDWSA